jgi:putative membrane protein
MLVATIVAVVILPLIYAGLYLWAFWDPYSKIDQIPVAVVNLDPGDKNENLGNDLVQKLKDNQALKWDFTDLNTAQTGLKDKKYYSSVIIPSDFTQKIANADQKDATKTYLEYQNRESSNFMAAKFSTSAYNKIQSTLNSEITKRYFDEVFKESLKNANKLKDAVDGATDLKNGVHDIATGSAKLNDGLNDAYNGAATLDSGANKLYYGVATLQGGIHTASTASAQLKTGLDNLSSGVRSLEPLLTAMNYYLADNHDPTMSAYVSQLNSAMSQTGSGISQLQSGASDLSNGLSTLDSGVDTLKNGANDLNNGTGSLKSGINDLKTGGQTIHDNLITAKDGAATLANKLDDNRKQAVKKINDENSNLLSKPIDLTDDSIDLVSNNGTGFAPYFESISLWVGSMAIFFLVEFKKGKKWPKLIITLIIGLFQAIILDLVLIKGLGLQVKNLFLYFEFSIILAWCFGLIQFSLNYFLKEAGKFIAIILLMLQLTSSAGSYPLETAPLFFQKINPFLPMTYSVNGLREIISGGNMPLAYQMLKTIIIISLVFLIINSLSVINWGKIKSTKKHGKHK